MGKLGRVAVLIGVVLGAVFFPAPSLASEPARAEAATAEMEATQPQALAEEHDRALGLALAKYLMACSAPWGGSKVNNYAERMALKIAGANHLNEPLVVHVLYSTRPRVLALRGGFIFVNSGVLSAAITEQDFAAAVAHGIAHLHACRVSPSAPKRPGFLVRLTGLSSSSALRVARRLAGLDDVTACGGATRDYSREAFEREADRLTEEYLLSAGYDPALAVDVLNLIESWRSGGGQAGWSYAHPFMNPLFSAGPNSVEGLPQMKLVREDQSEFQAVHSEVLQYDLVYARALGEALPGEDQHPRLMRRPESTPAVASHTQDSLGKAPGL